MEQVYRQRIERLRTEINVLTRAQVTTYLRRLEIPVVGRDPQNVLLRAVLLLPNSMTSPRNLADSIMFGRKVKYDISGVIMKRTDDIEHAVWLIRNINIIPLEWFRVFEGSTVALSPGAIAQAFEEIPSNPAQPKLNPYNIEMLKVSESSHKRQPFGSHPAFEIVSTWTDDLSYTQARIKLQNGNVTTFPYGIISRWGIPLDGDNDPILNITAKALLDRFAYTVGMDPNVEEVVTRARSFIFPSIRLRPIDYVMLWAGRPELVGKAFEKNDPIFTEIINMPVHVHYGLPPPVGEPIRNISPEVRLALENARTAIPENDRPPYPVDDLITSGSWDVVLALAVKLQGFHKAGFIAGYFGYPARAYDKAAYTVMRIGGLHPNIPNRYNLGTTVGLKTLTEEEMNDIASLLGETFGAYETKSFTHDVLRGILPTPNPELRERFKVWTQYALQLQGRITRAEWMGSGRIRNDGIAIARMITPSTMHAYAKQYRMILPFVNTLRYAIFNALQLQDVATDPTITDRAIVARRGYHRYYQSVEGFHRGSEPGDIIVPFQRRSTNIMTRGGVPVTDTTRLLFGIMNRNDGYVLEDIGTLLFDPDYIRRRPALMDILYQAIDAKHNPGFNPFLTAIYRGLTDEEEDIIDMVNNES